MKPYHLICPYCGEMEDLYSYMDLPFEVYCQTCNEDLDKESFESVVETYKSYLSNKVDFIKNNSYDGSEEIYDETIFCPECGTEGFYHNGEVLICKECGKEISDTRVKYFIDNIEEFLKDRTDYERSKVCTN